MFEFLSDCVSIIVFEQTPVRKFPDNPFFSTDKSDPHCVVLTLLLNRFLDEIAV